MNLIKTSFEGLFVIEPKVFNDARGYFFESSNTNRFQEVGINERFVQDYEFFSTFGTIRGLYYQLAPYAQSLIVRAIQGEILIVAVDIRKNSTTFGMHFSFELNDTFKQMIYIPKGFAYGFSVLSSQARVLISSNVERNTDAERGIDFNDSELNIKWKIGPGEAIVSAKDSVFPPFKLLESNFVYGGNY